MGHRRRACRYDEATIRLVHEFTKGTLDLASVARVDCTQFHTG